MSVSIDNRVVRMEFDNQDFKSRIKDTLRDLATLDNALKLADAAKGFAEVQRNANSLQFGGVNTALSELNSKFSAFGVFAATALNRVSNAVIDLGTNLVRSLAIDPIRQGFDEYELKMRSVQTIIASTGESLSVVNGYLDELNKYADKTIYSFSDMTQNIGKFTNAGVGLDSAVKAIQGIANEAAVSGANANEASRAMYNFAQALSSGSVKLIDWKSIENANMATVEFKQQLLDTAVALGTVVKQGDEYVSTTTDLQGKVSDAFTATHAFNDSLAHQWLTTDVLTETLSHYSSDIRTMTEEEKASYEERLRGLGFTEEQIQKIEELGMKAFDAAQDVKTFTQLIDTIKESVGSGWAQTFELIFGDLEEAKQLWTGVNNVVGGFVSAVSDYRNEALQFWHDNEGRDKLIEALATAFNFLGQALSPIGDAFNKVFGQSSQEAGQALLDLTDNLLAWSKSLSISEETLNSMRSAFEVFFGVIKDVATVVGGGLQAALSILSPILRTVIDIFTLGTGVVSKFLLELRGSDDIAGFLSDKLRAAGSSIGEFIDNARKGIPTVGDFGDGISKVAETMRAFGAGVKNVVTEALKGFLDIINAIKPGLAEFFQSFSIGDIFGGINAVGTASLATTFAGLIKSIRELGDAKAVLNPLSGTLGPIKNALNELGDTLKMYQATLNARTLILLASAIAILAVALASLSKIDPVNLAKGTVAIGALLNMMVASMTRLGTISTQMVGFGAAMVGFSAGILILSVALKKLGELELGQLAQGGGAIIVLMFSLVTAMNMVSAAGAKIVAGAAAIDMAAAGIMVLVGAIAVLAIIPAEQLKNSLFALGAGLLEMAIALDLMKASIGGAAALTVAAVGIAMLAPALALLAAIPIESLCGALVILGGAFTVMGVAAALIEPVIVPLMALGAALALIGVGIAGLGAGLFLVAAAFQIISVTGAGAALVVSEALNTIITGFAEVLPVVATQLAEGITQFIEKLSENGARIIDAVGSFLMKLIESLASVIPSLIAMGIRIVDEFLKSLAEHMPSIVQSGLTMVGSLLTGIAEGLPQIVDAGWKVIISYINSMADAIRANHNELYDAGWNLFTALLEALADLGTKLLGGLDELGGQFIDGVKSWWDGLWGASEENGQATVDGYKSGAEGAEDAAREAMDNAASGVSDSAGNMEAAGAEVGEAATTGVDSTMSQLPDYMQAEVNVGINRVESTSGSAAVAGRGVGSSVKQGAGDGISGTDDVLRSATQHAIDVAGSVNGYGPGEGVGSNFGAGLADGIRSWASGVADMAYNLVAQAKAAANSAQRSASPAKDLIEIGGWFGEGYMIGIRNTIGGVAATSRKMVEAAKEPLDDFHWNFAENYVMALAEDVQPTIRPVLDLGDVESGMWKLDRMLQTPVLDSKWSANLDSGIVSNRVSDGSVSNTKTNTYNITLDYKAGADANAVVAAIGQAIKQRSDLEG